MESEGYSDDKITSDMMDSLRAAYWDVHPRPRARLHRPLALALRSLRPRHLPPCAGGRNASTMRRLVNPWTTGLFFAGDATNKDFPGSTRGAFLSGQREELAGCSRM